MKIRKAGPGIGLALTVLLLSGCAADPLAEQFKSGGTKNYIAGSDVVEVPLNKRANPIEFTGMTDSGVELSRSAFAGEVLVVNFWYAACPPCRSEAPDLASLSAAYQGKGASFVGVNIYDGAEQSLAFARTFKIPYPSILDKSDGRVRLAFAGEIAPSAVPVTFVLDRQGRIAARILGQIQSRSILDSLIRDTIAEPTG